MKQLAIIFSFAAVLYAASSVGQACAGSHVRPPDTPLGHPTPTDTEWSRGEIAAWIQAIGTIIAFVGAVFLSTREHQRSIKMFEAERAREEGIRHLRAHSLAHALYPDLIELKAIIRVSEAAITRRRRQGPNLIYSPEMTQDWEINVPEHFRSTGEMYYLLGTDTAPVVSQLLSLLHQHNRAAGRLIEELKDQETFAHAWAVFTNKELFANRFRLMSEDVEEALDLISKIRDRRLLPEYILKATNDQNDYVAPAETATDLDNTAPS